MTPQGSTHVETFTGTTSSVSRTATGKLAVVAAIANRFTVAGAEHGDLAQWERMRVLLVEDDDAIVLRDPAPIETRRGVGFRPVVPRSRG